MGLGKRFGNHIPSPHILGYARGSWQRLGHLKMLCSIASPSNSTNLEGVTSQFQTAICRLVSIPPDSREQVAHYIKYHRYVQYYKGLPDTIEAQDLYLSDPRLPSQVGALTGRLRGVDYLHMEYVEIPAWAVRLKLLREGNYTLTDRGKILNIISSSVDNSRSEGTKREENPFILSEGEKFLFIYWLLEADGDVIKKLYTKIVQRNEEITVGIFRETMLQVTRDLTSEPASHSISSSTETDLLQKMIKALERNSDQIVIPRIEPLVDCGFIIKHDRNNTYKMPINSRIFLDIFNEYATIDEFLDLGLAKAVINLLGIKSKRSEQHIRRYIAGSYLKMRTGLGYCSILELAMLTIATAINEYDDYFEIHDVKQCLLSLSAEFGSNVRFTKNRQGDIALVRIERKLAENISAAID
jgi:hypothetical protein